MTQDLQVQFVVYPGPSRLAPFPAVMATFQPPPGAPLPAATLQTVLRAFLPGAWRLLTDMPEGEWSFTALVAHLAQRACDRHGPWSFRREVLESPGETSRILLEHVIPAATIEALKVGLELANLAFQHGQGHPVDPAPCLGRVQQQLDRWDALHSDPNTLGQMRVAHRRGIPVYDVVSAPRFRLFGQGAASHLAECTADDRDGYSGCHLASDKALSNQVVRRLGLPGVEHRVARGLQEALAAARQLGFPVVVKPRGGDMGQGVTAGIPSEAELIQAYHHAVACHPGPVLIEQHVPGDTHRMVVLGGRFAWALRYRSARVTGDGRRSMAELLAAENDRRAADPSRPAPRPLTLDDPMQALLRRQGLTLEDRPEAGRVILLRTTSNWITGGTGEDVTPLVHPDNRSLVEGLARSFRLAATGLDVITPDIGRSWRAGGLAVLEVNPTPGLGGDAQLEAVMEARFPGGSQGRIPTVLLLGTAPEAALEVHGALEARSRRTGLVMGDVTQLGAEARFPRGGHLVERIRGLLLDPGCEALVVHQDAHEVEALPLDRFDAVVLDAAPEPGLRVLADAAQGTVLTWSGTDRVERILAALRG